MEQEEATRKYKIVVTKYEGMIQL